MLLSNFNLQTIFGEFTEIIQKADISITNLECPLTLIHNPIDKLGPNFKTHPKIACVLKEVGFDVITLANNHIYDQGQYGLKDTIESLMKQHLHFVGAGETLEKAKAPLYITVEGIKLAVINITEVEFSCANENHGGANPMDLVDNIHQIKEAKKNADKVMMIIHGGHEHNLYPSPETMKRYRFYAENGADVIICHHTHCISGYELYNGTPIFYSLGNFLFPLINKKKSKLWFEGYSVLLKICEEKINFDILPYEQCKEGQIMLKLKSKDSNLYKKIVKISEELNDEEIIRSKFKEYVEEKRKYDFLGGLSGLNISIIFLLKKLRKFGLLKIFIRKKHMKFIKQAITCQAHRETSIKILKDFLRY